MPLKVVLTGAPGTGKSTTLNLLIQEGFFCLEEISREIIKKAEQEGNKNMFLSEPILFSEAILNKRIEQFNEGTKASTPFVFFDRGIPDVTAYLNHVNTSFPNYFTQALENHSYDLIFVFPPWEEIYTNDSERFESFKEAVKIDQAIVEEYQQNHNCIIKVPTGTPQERVAFILKECYAKQPCNT